MGSSAARREQAAREKAERRIKNEPLVLEFNFDPGALLYGGPNITTAITVTQEHADALKAAGSKVPDPVVCRFLIDTGADGCVVKHEIADKAGLKLINANAPLHGIGVDTTGKAYMGRVLFQMQSKIIPTAQHTIYVDTEVKSGNLKTNAFDGLIGRDVLRHFAMTYDGKSGRVTMRYHRPPR